MTQNNTPLLEKFDQLLELLARMTPPCPQPIEVEAADCFVWDADTLCFEPVRDVNRIDLSLIKAVDPVRDLLLENTRQFAKGLPANNVLLWGARGMGKSSLVKAVQAKVNNRESESEKLKLVEIHREDINTLPLLLKELKKSTARFILFCDDLSFDHDDTSYKSLKAALEGGIEGRPRNVVFYATSNRRHLMPRDMIDNEQTSAINPSEAVEEKVSLSDRFGLWLGFHKCTQDDYLAMVTAYKNYYGLVVEEETLRHQALEWATTRGNRSGRVAWQFIQDLAGRLGQKLEENQETGDLSR